MQPNSKRLGSSSAAPLLAIEELEVRGPHSATPILDRLSFEISSGESVGLLGLSGCGKSTTALSILGTLPESFSVRRGRILFAGRNLLDLCENELRRIRGAEIAMIFQEPALALNPVMKVGTQITEVMRAHMDWNAERRRREAKNLLEQLEFEDIDRIFNSYAHQLSGGQCQRVLIAQALACRPKLLIADEPTASLDTTTQAEILKLLRRLCQERDLAMLFITHDPALLAGFTDRVLVMEAGKIVEQGRLEDLLRRSSQPFTQELMRAAKHRVAGAA